MNAIILNGDNLIFLADITRVEIVAAIARRARAGAVPAADLSNILNQFQVELAGVYLNVELTPSLLDQAMNLVQRHTLRGYDAVQLAAALETNRRCLAWGLSLTFVCADAELNAAALAEGLLVENPNAHP